MPMVLKTRNTSYEKTKTQVGSAFVSVYDMYDTFQVAKVRKKYLLILL